MIAMDSVADITDPHLDSRGLLAALPSFQVHHFMEQVLFLCIQGLRSTPEETHVQTVKTITTVHVSTISSRYNLSCRGFGLHGNLTLAVTTT